MKTVLILVLSTDKDWYWSLMEASRDTWDAEEVEEVETIFYFGRSDKQSTDKLLFLDVDDGFFDMGKKELAAFQYALANRQFDYAFLANASLYVDKLWLRDYIQDKPDTNLALGVCTEYKPLPFLWGPARLLSRDVIEKLVENQGLWDHSLMEDVALSHVLHALNVPLDGHGTMATIAEEPNGEILTTYYGDHDKPFCYRVKQDGRRDRDIAVMHALKKTFNARHALE